MARIAFGTNVLMKLVMWALTGVGIYLGARALIDGQIGLGLAILLLVVPVALAIASMILAYASMIVLFPIAAVLGQRRQLNEFACFQIAVAEGAGMRRLNLRHGYTLMRLYEQLPRLRPDEPSRSGNELREMAETLEYQVPFDGAHAYNP